MTYNPNFQWQRKTVTVSVPTSSLPAGYQVKLIIPKETEMQADFRDLRFETTDGYGLSHWLESINTTPNPDEATVWVKLKDSVTAPTTVDIYMYYGNPYVKSASSGDNTFEFFDDFSTNTIGTNWTGDTTKASIIDNILTMNSGNVTGSFWIYNTKTMSNSSSFVIESKLRTIDGYGRFGIEDTFVQQAVGDGAYTWYISSSGYNSGGTLSANTWYKHKFTYDGTYLKLYINDSGTATVTRTYTPTILNKRYVLGTASNPTQNSTNFDYIFSRKYVSTEPSTPTIGITATTVNWNPQRKAITINTTTATPANYQVKLTIPFSQEMNIDFSDLRFVTKANPPVSLDYWIESSTPGVTADIWIELADAINASSSDYIYMHYGNPNLTSASNGTNTFLFFDNFDGNTIDLTKWSGNTAAASVSNGFLTATGNGTSRYINSIINFNGDTTPVYARFHSPLASVSDHFIGFTDSAHTGTDEVRWYAGEGSPKGVYTDRANAGNYFVTSNTWTVGKSNYDLVWGTNIARWYIDGIEGINSGVTTNIPNISLPLTIRPYNSGISWVFDYIYVRKYIATEPTFSIGTAESTNSFAYRKIITINNNSGSSLTDYQVPITVTYNAHMQSNFDDIRFVDSDGNLLSYWIESKTDSSTAYVWIKVNLPNYGTTPTGDNIVYIYYGNSSIISASSGNNTFLFFDDFSGSSFDTNKWQTTTNMSIGGSNAYTTLNDARLISLYSFTPSNVSVEARASVNAAQGYYYTRELVIADNTIFANPKYICFGAMSTTNFNYRDTSTGGTFTTPFDGSYHRFSIQRTTGSYTLVFDSQTATVGTTNSPTTTSYIHAGTDTNGGGLNLDWVFARKYVSPAPTYTTGTEQIPADITAISMTITPSETPCRHNICTVTVDVTWTNNGTITETFLPNITIDTVPVSPDPYPSQELAPSANVTKSFIISGLAVGTRNICPYPN